MMAFFANIFGYLLNFLYEIIGNYGLAIILFSLIVKLLMIPISIKQQKSMKKSKIINAEMKKIQFQYKNDPEMLNREIRDLYKREKMSPTSGCLSAIVQMLLLLSVFYLVRSPLTYMKKVDKETIEKLETYISEQGIQSNYKEIAVINYINNLEHNNKEDYEKTENQEDLQEVNKEDLQEENKEELQEENKQGTETAQNVEEDTIKENQEEFNIRDYIDDIYINMNFFGVDLSKVPTEQITNIKVWIIPVLYVLSTFISMKITTNTGKTIKKKSENEEIEEKSEENNKEEQIEDPMEQATKNMSYMMPIMSISIVLIAPLGLALYWLVNNIFMIVERLILNKFIKDEEERTIENA